MATVSPESATDDAYSCPVGTFVCSTQFVPARVNTYTPDSVAAHTTAVSPSRATPAPKNCHSRASPGVNLASSSHPVGVRANT